MMPTAKELKQQFFAGKGNITSYCEITDPKLTAYQDVYKGK